MDQDPELAGLAGEGVEHGGPPVLVLVARVDPSVMALPVAVLELYAGARAVRFEADVDLGRVLWGRPRVPGEHEPGARLPRQHAAPLGLGAVASGLDQATGHEGDRRRLLAA